MKDYPDPFVEHAEEIKAYNAEQEKAEPAPAEETQDETPVTEAEPAPAEAQAPVEPAPVEAEEPDAVEIERPAKSERFVPLRAVQESREKEKAERERANALERQLAELRGYNSAVQEFRSPAKVEPADEAPDAEIDPIGALKYERSERVKMKQQFDEQEQVRSITTAYQQSMASLPQERKPEVADAYNFFFTSRLQEIMVDGISQADAQRMVMHEEINLADASLRAGRHPAEVIVAKAKARNWVMKPPIAVTPTVVAPLDPATQEAKQAAALTISKGGKTPRPADDPERLLELEGAAFDSAWDKTFARKKSVLR